MSYKKLKNFRNIINRDDFNYISNLDTIERVSNLIRYLNTLPDREQVYNNVLRVYAQNLNSFCEWIGGDIDEIIVCNQLCNQELSRSMDIYAEEEEKRNAISNGMTRKFEKKFLLGLSSLLKGVKEAFRPNINGATNITQKQLVNYFFDEIEGLGKNFEYHTEGKFAFAKRLFDLNKVELIYTMKLLTERPETHIRQSKSGWVVLGASRVPIRILLKKKNDNKVYFLFKNTQGEKTKYGRTLDISPDTVQFKAA